MFMMSQSYLNVQGILKVPKGQSSKGCKKSPGNSKGVYRYLKVPDIQKGT